MDFSANNRCWQLTSSVYPFSSIRKDFFDKKDKKYTITPVHIYLYYPLFL